MRLLQSVVLAMLLAGCRDAVDPAPAELPVAEVAASVQPVEAAPSFVDVLGELDARLASAREQARAHPDDWSRAARVAELLRQRFRLSSDLADLLEADAVLDDAFSKAVPGGGPWASRAAVSASLHELAPAEEAHTRMVQRPLGTASERATALRGLAQVALSRGELTEARTHLAAAGKLSQDVPQACAEARLAELTDSAAAAEALFATAAERNRRSEGEPAAWIALQRARLALSRDQLSVAAEHLAHAEAALPGWWSTAAARSELALAQGDRAAALEALTVAAAGSPHPEFAARRAVLLAESDLLAATELLEEARSRMDAWRERAPAAMATHAAELALAEGEAARGLALAKEHARTHADAAALVLLIRAATLAGDPELAERTSSRLKSGGWSADHVADLCAGGGCPRW